MYQSGVQLSEILAEFPITPADFVVYLEHFGVDHDTDLWRKQEMDAAKGLLELGEKPWQVYLAGFSIESIASAIGITAEAARQLIQPHVELRS